MSEYVRVADKETGHHVSILRARYEANPDVWRELKSPAAYADGTPRPPKHKTSVRRASGGNVEPPAPTPDPEG